MAEEVLTKPISLPWPAECGPAPCHQPPDSLANCDGVAPHLTPRALRRSRRKAAKAASSPPWERGMRVYKADMGLPLIEPPIRVGDVWHLGPEGGNFKRATLRLHLNGLDLHTSPPGGVGVPLGEDGPWLLGSWALSPFTLVQACRLHSPKADAASSWLRLFKVSHFHYGETHYFVARSGCASDRRAEALVAGRHNTMPVWRVQHAAHMPDTAAWERARWVADIARAIRLLTRSLLPPFRLSVMPVAGVPSTMRRLLAGYMLFCDEGEVTVLYCELQCYFDMTAAFVCYKDESCREIAFHIDLDLNSSIRELVGIDCSCFSIEGHHFSARSTAEKTLWLRAISNIKVKLKNNAENPNVRELAHYRAAILEHLADETCLDEDYGDCEYPPLLPRTNLPGMPLEDFAAAAAIDGSSGTWSSEGEEVRTEHHDDDASSTLNGVPAYPSARDDQHYREDTVVELRTVACGDMAGGRQIFRDDASISTTGGEAGAGDVAGGTSGRSSQKGRSSSYAASACESAPRSAPCETRPQSSAGPAPTMTHGHETGPRWPYTNLPNTVEPLPNGDLDPLLAFAAAADLAEDHHSGDESSIHALSRSIGTVAVGNGVGPLFPAEVKALKEEGSLFSNGSNVHL